MKEVHRCILLTIFVFSSRKFTPRSLQQSARTALEVFCLYEAEGEYFDISDPSHIFRDQIHIGQDSHSQYGYWIEASCTGCGACLAACPQKCIDLSRTPAVIDQHHCLHCGRCAPVCPVKAVMKGSKNS